MSQFRKKPVVIEAEQITDKIEIQTREGTLYGYPGEWLITGIHGEKYPCKPDIFRETYEPVEEEEETVVTTKEFVTGLLAGFYRFLTSAAFAFGVIFGGILANNTLYYHTGLTTAEVPLIIPCIMYFAWSFFMSFVETEIEWKEEE